MTQAPDTVPNDAAKAAADALSAGDFVTLRELLADDVVWYANGDPSSPAIYRGRDAVIAALRVQRAQGDIATSDLVEVDEPEVQAFGFTPNTGVGTRYFSVNGSASKRMCGETVSVLQVNGPVITSFGSLPAPKF